VYWAVVVGRATEEDGAAVTALWTAAYTDDPRGGRRAPYSVEDFRSTVEAGEVLVAREDGALAGVVAFYPPGARDGMIASGSEAELSRLAVAEGFRRRGIGQRLVQACLQLAGERSAPAIVLWSRPHQVEAHRLYSSMGFRRDPDRDASDPDGVRLVFVRRL
jgi:ribosomal protein S18 acetylase RimI-like enzyme